MLGRPSEIKGVSSLRKWSGARRDKTSSSLSSKYVFSGRPLQKRPREMWIQDHPESSEVDFGGEIMGL